MHLSVHGSNLSASTTPQGLGGANSPLEITEAQYVTINDHPFLRLIINNNEALIGDFKYSLLQRGFVPLTSSNANVDWEKILSPILLPDGFELKGFSCDPIIIKMAKDFWKASNDMAKLDDFDGRDIPIPLPGR